MSNKETIPSKEEHRSNALIKWLAATSAAALIALGTTSCSDWTTKTQDKDEVKTETTDKKQIKQDANQPTTVEFTDVKEEPKEPPKPENEKGIENSDEAKSAIKDYVKALWNLNIKWLPNFESVKKLSKASFDITYNWEWGESIEDVDIKKDKDWDYFIANWKKVRIVYSDEIRFQFDNADFEDIGDWIYYADWMIHTISNNWKTYVKILHRSWVWDYGWYYAQIINIENWEKVTYIEDEIHDQIFKLRGWKFMYRLIEGENAKGYWVFNFPRLFRFEWMGDLEGDLRFTWTWIFHFKDWTIFKWTLTIKEDWDYLDLYFRWNWELIRKDWKKEMIDWSFDLDEDAN